MKATVRAVHSDAVAAAAAHSVVAVTAEASAVVRQQAEAVAVALWEAEAAHAEDDEKVKEYMDKVQSLMQMSKDMIRGNA